MPLFEWDDSYCVHIAEIDDQHKKMIGILNRLYESVQQGTASSMLKPIFLEFLDYLKEHFATEERLMLQHQYPGYQAHKKEHEACFKRTIHFKVALDGGNVVDPVDACQFLKTWLEEHIAGEDQEYVAFFNAKGVR